MDQRPWNILLVEDDEDDYVLTRDMLREACGDAIILDWCPTYPAALQALQEKRYDAALVDYHLGAYRGVDLPAESVLQGNHAAFILLTGQGNYQVDLQATRAGFADFLVKGDVNPRALERSLRYAIERQRLVHQVEEQKSFLEAIFQTDPGGLAVLTGPDLRFQFVNPAYRAITPNPDLDPIGMTFREIWPDEGGARREGAIRRLLEDGEPVENLRAESRHPDGRTHIYSIHMRCMEWGDRPAVLAIVWDVTDVEETRQQAVHLAAEVHQRASEVEEGKRILEAQHYLLQYRENERLQIARDIHDGPIQELIAANYTVQALMAENLSEDLKQPLKEIQDRIQGQVHDLRSICNDLRPPALAPFGLEKALRSHLEEFQQAHPEIQIKASLDQDGQVLSNDVRLALYRISQELLNNVVRHAQATLVQVEFHMQPGQVELTVRDNGRGFDLPQQWVELARQGHYGLVGIEERATAVGGKVRICSQPGEGACVHVTVPLNQ